MSIKQQSFKKVVNREAGMVAIMVTLILMIVISLLVLGFAQISRRNQRQALDRQLSTQAFYAAESGVNDAANLIRQAVANGQTVPPKETCGPGSGSSAAFYAGLTPVIDANANVEYTCVMVNPSPPTLRYGDVGSTSVIVPLIPESGNLTSVTLNWQSKDESGSPLDGCPTSAGNVFTPTGSWQCGYGVLRFDLVPTNGPFDAATLQNRTMTSFLLPLASGGTSSIPFAGGAGNTNNRVGVNCSGSSCSMTITGLNANQYYMRVSSQYKSVSLQVTGTNADGAVGLQDAQAVIDSTGKAQDVLRRIQVHLPLSGSSRNQLSDFAIQTNESLCKRFSAMDGYFNNQVNGVTSANPMCSP